MLRKRKVRNLSNKNDQMTFFTPVYQNNNDENENDLLAEGIPRNLFSNVQDHMSDIISTSKILSRIKQIQNSIPDSHEQLAKLDMIINDLQEQQGGYVNLLKLTNQTAEEENSSIKNRNSVSDDDDNSNRPRIESKIGFRPQTSMSTAPATNNSSDNEQINRNDNSNYDSLVGSLKSDTLNCRDEENTSVDGEENEKDVQNNLMLRKEQLRALQGRKRALSALKKRSHETQDLLSNIINLRNRLNEIGICYERKYQNEIQGLELNSTRTKQRLKNLKNVREELDQLEQIVMFYENDSTQLNQLSTKRLELEQAKSTLTQLERMVKKIQPNHNISSASLSERQTPTLFDKISTRTDDPNVKMAAQHREIERLIESRQRLHTIKDQIASLHQTIVTPLNRSQESIDCLSEQRTNDIEHPTKSNSTHLKQSNFCASNNFSMIKEQNRNELNIQINEICRCLSTFIEEQKQFNHHIEQRLTQQTNDPLLNQFQQQTFTQGLIIDLSAAYREIAVLQSEINSLQSENSRLISSISFDNQYHQSNRKKRSRNSSENSIYKFDSNFRPKPRAPTNEPSNHLFEKLRKTTINDQINVQNRTINRAGTKNEENLSKRKDEPISNHISSPTQQLSESKYERELNDISATALQIQPSAYYIATHQDFNNMDFQTLDLQVKSIMVQLIPFMRLRINEIFNQTNLNHIRERILFLFKQQSDSNDLIRHFQEQFSQLLEQTLQRYCGTTVRTSAADLIRDISDVAFDELVKYKIYCNKQSQQDHSDTFQLSIEKDLEKISFSDDMENNKSLTLVDVDNEENNNPIITELNSNGHEYVFVNCSTGNDVLSSNNNQ